MARSPIISQIVAGSQPSVSVSGRADGGGYTVTAGARSLSITAEAGATLLTTVTDQDNASITVTDSTSTTPSWTAPGGGTTGADYCVQVTATKGGYTEQVSFSELVDGSGGGGGGSSWTSVMDWSSSSETFAAGEGSYTIGGLSVTLSYEGSAGPSSIDLSSGVLTIQADASDFAYLVIDLGEDFTNVPLWACVSADSVSGLSGTGAIFWQMCDDTTTGNAAGHWQEIIGSGGTATAMLGRYATGTTTFVTANSRTVTNITTTPTRAAVYIDGTDFRPSFDQGTASLPADGTDLGTVGPKSYTSNSGAYTTTSARNQRYMHLQIKCNATIRMAAAKRS